MDIELALLLEKELTHVHNMIQISTKEIDEIVDRQDNGELLPIYSLLVKADETIVEQLDNILEVTAG